MLRASGVDIRLSPSDLEEIVAAYTIGISDPPQLRLEDGAVIVRVQVHSSKLPRSVPVELRLTARKAVGTVVEAAVEWTNSPLLPGFLKGWVLEKAFESLPGHYENGLLTIDVSQLLDQEPVAFRLNGLEVRRDGIRVSLSDVVLYPLETEALTSEDGFASGPQASCSDAEIPEEHQEFYQSLRQKVKGFAAEKAPRWVQPLVPWVLAVPDFFVLVVRLARDARIPVQAKVMAGAMVAYIVAPLDLIPDMLPITGQVDDVAVVLFGLDQIAKVVPAAVVQECWPGEGEVLEWVRQGTNLFGQVLPARLMASIRRVLSKRSS